MNEFAEFHEQGFEEARDTLGQEFVTINGTPIKAVVNLTPVRIEPTEGGDSVRVQDLYVTLKKADLESPPPANVAVIHNGALIGIVDAAATDEKEIGLMMAGCRRETMPGKERAA